MKLNVSSYGHLQSWKRVGEVHCSLSNGFILGVT